MILNMFSNLSSQLIQIPLQGTGIETNLETALVNGLGVLAPQQNFQTISYLQPGQHQSLSQQLAQPQKPMWRQQTDQQQVVSKDRFLTFNYAPVRGDDIAEVPEHIFVETRFISNQNTVPVVESLTTDTFAQQDAIYKCPDNLLSSNVLVPSNALLINSTSENPVSSEIASQFFTQSNSMFKISSVFSNAVGSETSNSSLPAPKVVNDKCVGSEVQIENRGTMTDYPNPTRERSQQTETVKPLTATVGTQCNVEDDYDYTDIVPEEEGEELPNADTIENFYRDNTNIYENGKCECLICGEIAMNLNSIKAHVTKHMESPSLCCICGEICENSVEFIFHQRIHQTHSKNENATLCCPHYKCNAMALSKLEMYRHIDAHIRTKFYECPRCQKYFISFKKFQNHALNGKSSCRGSETTAALSKMRKILKRIHRNGSAPLPKVLITKETNQQPPTALTCTFCSAICKNVSNFVVHRRRCMRKYSSIVKKLIENK